MKSNLEQEGEVVALADKRSDPSELEIRIDGVFLHSTPSRVARSLRYLLARGDLPKRFSVTSAVRGEGATTVSRSLAALIANDWLRSTCWVDLNWWAGPPAHESELFKATIVDVIAGRKISADLPVATSVPGLSFVAGGEVPASTRSRLPRSEALAGVVEELGHWFDFLVLDLPPVLATSDTLSLGSLTDGYLLVVRQRATSSAQVAAALSAMNAVPCLGTVLNGSRTRIPSWLHTSNELWALGDP